MISKLNCIDDDGNTSNFYETEIIIKYGESVFSHV